jgi:hypothetical protein
MRRLLLCLLCLCLAPLCRAADSFRLAVIGEDTHGLVPLLETTLSQSEDVTLIERKDLSQLVNEKELSGLIKERKFSALGQLLSADGLLVLEKIRLPGGQEEATMRLISVRNGACLLLAPLPKEKDLKIWADGVSAQVRQALPMARVSRDGAVPLCVVGLRASVFTPDTALREAALARLLEMRLASLPGVVLLDRRHLGDVAFERSLEASDLPSLRESTILIDGSFEGVDDSTPMDVHLRLYQNNGDEVASARFSGRTSDLPALADSLATFVSAKMNLPPSPSKAGFEADRFFAEAEWAWHSGLYDTAREALAAARALGDRSPDLTGLEIALLLERATPEGRHFQGTYTMPEKPAPSDREALFRSAFLLLKEYRAQGGKAPRIRESFNLQASKLKEKAMPEACAFLQEMGEDGKSAQVDVLRQLIKEEAGMKAEGPDMPWSMSLSSRYARYWADDSRELLTYYEKLLRADHKWLASLLKRFPSSADDGLGPRFRDDPAAQAAWSAMWKRLLADDHTRMRALLILKQDAKTPEQQAMYREFLRALAAQGASLYEKNLLKAFLEPDRDSSLHSRFQAERAATFVALCRTIPGFVWELSEFAQDVKFPPGSEQDGWNAFTAYRDRCLTLPADSRQGPRIAEALARWSGFLLKNNPGILPASPRAPLDVTRFWHPYVLDGRKETMFFYNRIVLFGDSIWLIDRRQRGAPDAPQAEILEIKIPSMQTRGYALEHSGSMEQLNVTGEALWILQGRQNGPDQPLQKFLTRLDRQTGETRQIPVPRGDELDVIGNRVFVRYGNLHTGTDSGLMEVDPVSGECRVLISARRNPPASPFDSSARLAINGILPGPNGQVWMAVAWNPLVGLYEVGDEWKKLDDSEWSDVLSYRGTSLLCNSKELMSVAPSGAMEIMLAGPLSAPDIREKARWQLPETRDYFVSNGTFRENELFLLERDGAGVYNMRWWFPSSPREGVVMPLNFILFPQDPSQVKKLADVVRDTGLGFEALKNPNLLMPGLLHILATPHGLVAYHISHGFWFIPNSDMESWLRKNHPDLAAGYISPSAEKSAQERSQK